MPGNKIAIIGGGSAYVPGIMYSLAHSGAALSGSEIALMDISPSRLPLMVRLGQRMADEAGSRLTVTSTTDLREALDGATFVLTNFRPGGLEGLRLDETIPAKYGILGQETTGPGGTFYALRSIPEALRLCAAIEENCPDAWVINYLNPTNFVEDAMRRRSRVKSIAICDGGGNGLRFSLPRMLGVGPEEIRVRAAGVNHHTWLLDLRVAGRDGYPLLRKQVQSAALDDEGQRGRYAEFSRWMLERYGVYPANASYLYPYYNYAKALASYQTGHSLYKMFATDLPIHWPRFEAMAEGTAPIVMDTTMHHTNVGHGELAVEIIVALATDDTREFHVNVPNQGSITNLPNGALIEVPALIDSSGVTPLCVGELPKGVVGLTEALINWEQLSVDAALSGDRDLVVQALLAHPWVVSVEAAERLCDEMLSAHAAYLPQFSSSSTIQTGSPTRTGSTTRTGA